MSDRPSSRPPALPPMPLPPMGVNWLGLWTLYLKEVRRFLNVYTQTVAAPVMTSLLFLAVFTLALGRGAQIIDGVPYSQFLAPGLVMMAMTQNAFANTSSSLVISKVQGNIVDLLMPPLSPAEVTLALTAAGITRGLLVGLVTGIAMVPFVHLAPEHIGFILFHAVAACSMLSLLGLVGGLWSEKFDHMNAIASFIISPLAFLSGTFYTTTRLPETWQMVAHLNPFFYMLDGFRYGFIGHADGNLTVGVILLIAMSVALSFAAYTLIRTGYRLKS